MYRSYNVACIVRTALSSVEHILLARQACSDGQRHIVSICINHNITVNNTYERVVVAWDPVLCVLYLVRPYAGIVLGYSLVLEDVSCTIRVRNGSPNVEMVEVTLR